MALITDLISYYKLDGTTGDVIDSHGSNHGTNYGATRGVTGKINNAFDFDGTDDGVSIPDIDFPNFGDFTWSVWGKMDTITNGVALFDFAQSIVSITHEGELDNGFEANYFDGSHNIITSGISDTNWHHFVLVWDSSSSEMEFFVDGNSQGTADGGGINDLGRPHGIGIGYNGNTGDRNFPGIIDEVGIWNRALTSDEVSDLYNNRDGLAYPFGEEEILLTGTIGTAAIATRYPVEEGLIARTTKQTRNPNLEEQ